MGVVDSISDTAVMNTLKKTNLSPGRKKNGASRKPKPAESQAVQRFCGLRQVHASWLNMAEIEIGTLSRQCLAQQIMSFEEMKRQVAAWQFRRNSSSATVVWRFSAADARCKLKKLYPVIL